jgi:hypothetical protein
VIFTASPTTGVVYQWLLNNNIIPGATAMDYTAVSSGSYKVEVSALGCSDSSAASLVTVNPLPVATITQSGNVLTATGGFSSYQWYWGGNPITGATSASYTILQNGSYYVVVSDGNCSGQSNVISTVVVSAANVQYQNSEPGVYPNPVKEAFTLRATLPGTSREATITITDAVGRKVFSTIIPAVQGKIDQLITLPAEMPPGYYSVKLLSANEVRTTSFVKR